MEKRCVHEMERTAERVYLYTQKKKFFFSSSISSFSSLSCMVLIGLVKCQFHGRNGKLERNPTWDLIHWTWTQNMYLSTIKIINLILKIRKNETK